MKREIYEAMKRRISVLTYEEVKRSCDQFGYDFEELFPEWDRGTYYRFNNDSLNDGVDECALDYIDPFICQMKTRNMWNVAQRFYSFIRRYENKDERLLKARFLQGNV